jgi:hypothetical protein
MARMSTVPAILPAGARGTLKRMLLSPLCAAMGTPQPRALQGTAGSPRSGAAPPSGPAPAAVALAARSGAERVGPAACVLVDREQGDEARTAKIIVAERGPGALGRDHDHVDLRRRDDPPEMDGEGGTTCAPAPDNEFPRPLPGPLPGPARPGHQSSRQASTPSDGIAMINPATVVTRA